MLACLAISTTSSWAKVRIMMACTMRSRFLATSYTDSRLPRLISAGERYSGCPPNCSMPTSNVTRVRKEGFSKIIASVFPLRTPAKSSGFAFTWHATCKKCRICWGEKSRIERKSLGVMLPPRGYQRRLVRSGEFLQEFGDRRSPDFFHFVAHPHVRFVEPDRPRQVDRCRHQHHIARHTLNGRLQFSTLDFAVSHGRQHSAEVWELFEGLPDGTNRERSGIDDLGCVVAVGSNHSGSIRHF